MLTNNLKLLILLVLLPLGTHIAFYYSLPLHHDEAYYWSMSQELSLSYYHHGPLVAWFLLPLSWFGEITAFKIRLLATAFMILTGLVLARLLFLIVKNSNGTINLTREINQGNVIYKPVFLFAYISLISPVTLLGGTIWTHDTPLFLFLSLSMLSYYYAYNSQAKSKEAFMYWTITGIWFGLALLSKYSAVLWGGSAFLFLMLTKPGLRHLASLNPWLAMLVSFLFCIPMIIWNWQNEWAGFIFHLTHLVGNIGGVKDYQSNTGIFVAGLLIALGPPLFWVLIRREIIILRSKNLKKISFIAWVSYLPIIFLFAVSFFNDVYLNWMAFSGLLLFMLFALYIYELPVRSRLLIYGQYLSQLFITGLLFYIIHADHPALSNSFFSYQQLESRLNELKQEYPEAYLYGSSYQTHAILCFAEKELLPYKRVLGINNHFEYIDKEIPPGKDVLVFSRKNNEGTRFAKYFDDFYSLEPIELTYKGKSHTVIYSYLGTNNSF